MPQTVVASVQTLADEVERTLFPCPEGFDEAIVFHALGLVSKQNHIWKPRDKGARLLAIAPFANGAGLDALSSATTGECTLVSRQETLDALSEDVLAPWDSVLVLSPAAEGETDDDTADRPTGLHAKVIGIEHGHDVSWFVGSANLTAAAFFGRNVEVMASMTGRKGRKGGRSGSGIERFIESGFINLCEPYHRSETVEAAPERLKAMATLEAARKQLLEDGALRVVCAPDGESWTWSLIGKLTTPPEIEIAAWPVSVGENQARSDVLPMSWSLPTARLTAFVAFRLRAKEAKVDDIRLTLKLPVEGIPENRLAQVLRTLIDTPEHFLRFLRALLGGLDGLVDLSSGDGAGTSNFQWGEGLSGETLLEDLVRIASRDPDRLQPVRKLIDDLRATEEGRAIVPDELFAVWMVVDEVIRERVKG